MGVLRSLTRWLKRLFRKIEDATVQVEGNDGYSELLISHLETLSKGKVMKLRKNGSRNSWKGEVMYAGEVCKGQSSGGLNTKQ